jgi:hypothetical protein
VRSSQASATENTATDESPSSDILLIPKFNPIILSKYRLHHIICLKKVSNYNALTEIIAKYALGIIFFKCQRHFNHEKTNRLFQNI